MGRWTSFKPGPDDTSEAIGDAAYTLFIHGVQYDSRNMKVGINMLKLKSYKDMIMRFMRLDKRGGFFDREDIEAGWQHWVSHEKYSAAVVQLADKLQTSVDELKATDRALRGCLFWFLVSYVLQFPYFVFVSTLYGLFVLFLSLLYFPFSTVCLCFLRCIIFLF